MSDPNEVVTGPGSTPKDILTEVLRERAQAMLAKAIRAEVAAYVDEHADLCDAHRHRLVVSNAHHKPPTIETGIGPVDVRQPRVHGRRVNENGERIRFTSKILPPYLRRMESLNELTPRRYLKGISTGDSSECLQRLLGAETASLSPTTVVVP